MMFVFSVVLGYCFGSLCSAVLICRAFGLPDPRSEGSRNPGATNVLRIAGKKYALMVLCADMLKGFLPVFLLKQLHAPLSVLGFTALAAVLGHMYPIFFKFRGGKGVATVLGALFGLNIILGALTVLTWLVIALLFGYSSLAAMVAIALAPFYTIAIDPTLSLLRPLLITSLLIMIKHHENIRRLCAKTEPKISWRKRS